MKGYLTAFSLECKKIFSSKGFWIFAIVILVLCLIVTASFKSLGELVEGMDDSVLQGGEEEMTAAEMAKVYEAQLEAYREAVESGEVSTKLSDKTETKLKNMIAICEFCAENDLNINKLITLGNLGSLNMSSADYVTLVSQITFAFVAIMAIVLAAKVFAGEIEDGTMRMQLTRPIRRSVLLTAKHTAVFATTMALGIVYLVLFMIIGAVFFKGSLMNVLIVDEYQNVAVINPYTAILLLTLFSAVIVEVLIQFTIFIGGFITKTGALAIPLVLYLFAESIASLLYSTGLPWAGLFTNLEWINGLTPDGAPIKGMSIYTMIAVTTVWFAGMTAANYLMFEKRDLK